MSGSYPEPDPLFSLKSAANMCCKKHISGVPQCRTCETCVLFAKLALAKEWFPRAGDFSRRKFVLGLIRRLDSLDLLLRVQNVLQPILGKDFTYSRSRINPSLTDDASTTGSDRALNRHLWQEFVAETWKWFKGGSRWTKQSYTLRLLQMCGAHLLHGVANLIHVLVIRAMQSALSRTDASDSQDQRTKVMELMEQYGLKDPERVGLHPTIDDPCLMMVPTSFQATSGVRKYRDFIQCLPLHLSQMILGYLDRESLSSCASVSRPWRYVVKDVFSDLQAGRLIENDTLEFRGMSSEGLNASYAKMQQVLVPKIGKDGNVVAREQTKSSRAIKPREGLEAAYIDNETETVVMEERNVCCGQYNVLFLAEHEEQHKAIHFDGGRFMAVGTANHIVKLMDMSNMTQVPPLFSGHGGSIHVVRLCEDRGSVFSAGYDRSIRQWELQKKACKKLYLGHTKTITCLDVWENTLVSGAKDRQVKVWNVTSGKCLKTFKHKGAITEVKIKDQKVISSCVKGRVKIWHVESATLIKTLSGHDGPVKSLVLDQWHIVSGGADGNAIAWSMMGNFKKRLMTFKHPKEVTSVALLYLRVITGCSDGKIRIFNFFSGGCLREICAHSSEDSVLSLCVTDNRMIINVPSGIKFFTFEEVLWDYSRESSVRDPVPKERHKFKLAPIKSQPYSYVRAERMRHIGSCNKNLYREKDESEYEKSRLSHLARNLSARNMKRAQGAESGCSSQENNSALSRSEEATLNRMRRRGPHSTIAPNQILLKVSTIQNLQKLEEPGSNADNQDPNSHMRQKRDVLHPHSPGHHRTDCSDEENTPQTPDEIRKTTLENNSPLRMPEAPMSATTHAFLHSKASHNNEEEKRTSGIKVSGIHTSYESVEPLIMVTGRSEKADNHKKQHATTLEADLFQEKSNFRLRTVNKPEECEVKMKSRYKKLDAQEMARKAVERKKERLLKIKLERIETGTNEGKIAAPELGPGAFI